MLTKNSTKPSDVLASSSCFPDSFSHSKRGKKPPNISNFFLHISLLHSLKTSFTFQTRFLISRHSIPIALCLTACSSIFSVDLTPTHWGRSFTGQLLNKISSFERCYTAAACCCASYCATFLVPSAPAFETCKLHSSVPQSLVKLLL